MEPNRELADAIYRERILRARAMSFDEKLWGGAHLFDAVCERMRSGIRMQFPHADDDQVETILGERLARLRQVEEAACRPPNTPPN